MIIRIVLQAMTGTFETDTDRARKAFERDMKRIEDSAKKAGKVIGGALVAGAAATAAIVRQVTDSAREVQNLANIANTSAQEFQALAFGAKTVGIEQEKFSDILKDVNDRIGDFINTGAGPMKDFFEQIGPLVGVTIDDFRELSGPQALQLYYDSLEKANLSQAEMTFYLEAMASDTTALIPLLRDGGKGFQQLASDANQFGLVLDQQTITASVEFQRQLGILQGLVTGTGNRMTAVLLPSLQGFASLALDAARDSQSLNGDLRDAQVRFISLAAAALEAGDKVLKYAEAARNLNPVGLAFNFAARGESPLEVVDRIRARFNEPGAGDVFFESAMASLDEMERRAAEIVSQTRAPGRALPTIPGTTAPAAGPRESEAEKLLASLERQISLYGDLTNLEEVRIGLANGYYGVVSPDQSDELQRLARILDQKDAQRDAEQALLDKQREAAAVYAETRTPLEQLRAELERLNELRQTLSADGVPLLDPETYQRAVAAAQDAFARTEANAVLSVQTMEEFSLQAARNAQTAFADFLFNPFDQGVKGMVRSFAQALQRMAAEAASAAILNAILGGPPGAGGGGGGLLGSIAGLFGRASGGPVAVGSAYMVGEVGPEMFVPTTAGQIIPNRSLGGGSTAVRIVNAFDTGVIGDYLGTSSGEQLIMNVVSRNGTTIRSIAAGQQ